MILALLLLVAHPLQDQTAGDKSGRQARHARDKKTNPASQRTLPARQRGASLAMELTKQELARPSQTETLRPCNSKPLSRASASDQPGTDLAWSRANSTWQRVGQKSGHQPSKSEEANTKLGGLLRFPKHVARS